MGGFSPKKSHGFFTVLRGSYSIIFLKAPDQIGGIIVAETFRYGADRQICVCQVGGGFLHFQVQQSFSKTMGGRFFEQQIQIIARVSEFFCYILNADGSIIIFYVVHDIRKLYGNFAAAGNFCIIVIILKKGQTKQAEPYIHDVSGIQGGCAVGKHQILNQASDGRVFSCLKINIML